MRMSSAYMRIVIIANFCSPKSYELDHLILTQTYRKLQSFLHPDKFANKSEVNVTQC